MAQRPSFAATHFVLAGEIANSDMAKQRGRRLSPETGMAHASWRGYPACTSARLLYLVPGLHCVACRTVRVREVLIRRSRVPKPLPYMLQASYPRLSLFVGTGGPQIPDNRAH